MVKPAIKIWQFCRSPDKYRKLSKHYGDEDWIIFIPRKIRHCFLIDDILWKYNTSKHKVENGTIYILAHS